MDLFKKVADFIMPPMPVEEIQAEEAESAQGVVHGAAQEQEQAYEQKVAVNYGSASYMESVRQQETHEEVKRSARPQLTVHTTKVAELKVQVYTPTEFRQVVDMADDLKSGRAVVVNYDKVDKPLQRRICDFVNGVCYVLGGDARRITRSIVLYVPTGVDITDTEAMSLVD